MFMKISGFISFVREQGFVFALKYKLGLTKEGIDFQTWNSIEEYEEFKKYQK